MPEFYTIFAWKIFSLFFGVEVANELVPVSYASSLMELTKKANVNSDLIQDGDGCVGCAQMGEFEFYRNQLWTAPELLRIKTPPVNGTQKADVYSFAIILQEIIYRATPYFIDVDDPKGMHRMCWRVLAFRQNSSKICNSPLLAAKT